MRGVNLKGLLGWVPNVFVTQAYSRCPTVSFKAKKQECQPFTYMFKPFQVFSGRLQWKIRQPPVAIQDGVLCVPPNYSLWNGDAATLSIDNSELLEFDIMFRFNDGWYHVRLIAFYPATVRTAEKPYNYEVLFMDGSKEKMDIHFDLAKYSVEPDSPISSWFIITES